jgi:hypothetical protein
MLSGQAPFQTTDEDGLYVLHAKSAIPGTPISTKSIEDHITLAQAIIAALFSFVDAPLDIQNILKYKYFTTGLPGYVYIANEYLNGEYLLS